MDYYTYANNVLTKEPEFIRLPNGQTITSPTARQYATLRKAYPLSNEHAPTPPEGKIAVKTGYKQIGGYWVAQYEYQDAPPTPPRMLDVYKLIYNLKQIEVTIDGQTMTANIPVVEWAKENGLYEELMTVRSVSENDEDIMAGVHALKDELGLTDKQMEDLLNASVA